RRVGDKSLLSDGLRELGPLYMLDGDFGAAARVTEEALAEARAIGSMVYIFLALLQLILIASAQNEPVKAREYCSEVWVFACDSWSAFAAVFALLGFGMAACFDGELGRGVSLLAAFDTYLRQSGMIFTFEADPTYKVIQKALKRAEAQLGPAAFEAAWV